MRYDVTIESSSDTLTGYVAWGENIDAAREYFVRSEGYWLRFFEPYTLTLVRGKLLGDPGHSVQSEVVDGRTILKR